MRDYGSENFHYGDPDFREEFTFIDQEKVPGIGSDREQINKPRKTATKLEIASLALFLMSQGSLGESGSSYGQSRPREITSQTKELRQKLASGETRERTTGFKSLQQLYEEIETDEVERDFYQTNQQGSDDYAELFDKATENQVELNRDEIPIGPEVSGVRVAHTHIKRPLPPSMEDFISAITDKEYFSKKNIAVASQAIEASGRWTLRVNKNKQTNRLEDYYARQEGLNIDLVVPKIPQAVRENLELLNDPKYAVELKTLTGIEDEIQKRLQVEFPDISKDISQIRQIQESITVARENGRSKQEIDTLIKIYKTLAQKYGIDLTFEPRNDISKF